jgi:hypothetical protein
MTKGPHRLVLDRYLDSAAGGVLQGAGRDWKRKAQELQTLSDALQQAAQQAELRIGEQTLTGPAVRAGMEESASSMRLKSEQLRDAGQALVVVGQQVSDTRDARDSMADLGEKPAAYQAPPGTPGVEPTDEEIAAQAAASAARQQQRNAWQSDYDKQEAKALALTKDLDAAFIAAIPPMKEIHGQEDPTEPPPDVPSGPGGTYLPGTQVPIPTGGGAGGGDDKDTVGVRWDPTGGGRDGGRDGGRENTVPTVITCNPNPTPVTTTPTTTHVTHPTHVTETGTTTVSGTTQSGVTYQPAGPHVSSPATTGGTSGSTAAALGAAGAAGGAGGLAGAVRPGSMSSSAAGAAPARAIGSTARSASAGALSRSAASSAAPRSATSGSPASRSAGSAGSSAGRSGAGSRGATSGSTSGSRSGSRGASGARGAGTGSAGGRGGRKGERDRATDRDSLVYDQDWLGDDDVAPGVLD